MDDIPWVSKYITHPEEDWYDYAEKILRDVEGNAIQSRYGEVSGMLECSCPSPEHHEESRACSSPLTPCWFADSLVKYQFGILSCLKHVRPSEGAWLRLLKCPLDELSGVWPSGAAIHDDGHLLQASYFIGKGLDTSKEATQLFLSILDLANLLRLWDWKLSAQELLRLLTSEWALLENEHGSDLDRPATFSHPFLDLPLKVKQIRSFIQSLAMDLIYLSHEPLSIILKNLPYLLGQAIGPLWNLVRPWPEFVHANNFLNHFCGVFRCLLKDGNSLELPLIREPDIEPSENNQYGLFWRLGLEFLKSDSKCIKCCKKIEEYESFLAAQSPAKCIYPREVIISKPGEPVTMDVVCSYACHLAIGDHFKHLTWTDRLGDKLFGYGNVDTNGARFFRIRNKRKNSFPPITHRAFLTDANWTVTLRHSAESVFSNSLYQDLTRLLKDRQKQSQSLIQNLLKGRLDFINGIISAGDEDQTFLQDELLDLDSETTFSKDLGSIRCYWQRSWLPVGIFAKDNVDDVLVVSHFLQDHSSHYIGQKRVQEILELLVLEREFLVLPITKDICDVRDAKLGALFHLRRPQYRNNFSPESLKSGRWYMFARRLDLKTRNCVGGFLIPSSRNVNSWIGILVPDMFDRITRIPRLDATVQRLASFQKNNFKVHEIAKASIFISNNSIRRGETDNIKKTVYYVMGLMLHRDACEKGLSPRLDFNVKMIPFKIVLPNANFIDCTLILNFVFMPGDQFLPVIQHISQKMDWVFRCNFTIEEEGQGPVSKDRLVNDEHVGAAKLDRFKIKIKDPVAKSESHLPRVNNILTNKRKLVFDGELLVYRLHAFVALARVLEFIVPHDFVLTDILELKHFDRCAEPRGRIRWHFFYICGGAKPFDLSGMEDHTIEEIARAVGHIGCHFYVYITEDLEDVLTDGFAPPRPFPLFSKSHQNHALQNKNHMVLMWTGSLILPQGEHVEAVKLSGWLVHENGNFENPKHWQMFFKSLPFQTIVSKGLINEFIAQDLIKNSTMFSFSVAPLWFGAACALDHIRFIDGFRQTMRTIFGTNLEHQYALVVNIPGKEPRSGILLRDESGIGCRFYVPNDSAWTQRHFVPYNIPRYGRPLNNKISGSSSFKPNEKCYILGTLKALFRISYEVCDAPIYMVAKTYNPDISVNRLNLTNVCDEFTGSHSLVPIFRPEFYTLTSSMKELGFILGSNTMSIAAAFKPDLVYCDALMPISFDLSYFGALFIFQGSFTELRNLLGKRNYPEVAKRSLIAKSDDSSETITVFLFSPVLMETIVQSLVPLILSSTLPCQCYRKTQDFDIFVNIQKNEARRLWEDFDEKEQIGPISKESKTGKTLNKSKTSNDVMYPGMLKLFNEDKSQAIENAKNNESVDSSCSLAALYEAQEHFRSVPSTSSPKKLCTNSGSERQKKEQVLRDSNCSMEPAGKDTPTVNYSTKKWDPKATKKDATTAVVENKTEESIFPSKFTSNQVPPSALLKPLESIFQVPVSQEARNNVLEEMIHLTWKESVEKEEPLRVCDSCGREEFDMKVCNTCRASFFCNNKCFKKTQKIHKKICAQIVNQRLNLAMEILKQSQLPKL